MFIMADQIKTDSGINGEKDGATRPTPCMPKVSESSDRGDRYVDVTAMIRSLQRTEGLTDCFRRGSSECDQLECAWRQYCQNSSENDMTENGA